MDVLVRGLLLSSTSKMFGAAGETSSSMDEEEEDENEARTTEASVATKLRYLRKQCRVFAIIIAQPNRPS